MRDGISKKWTSGQVGRVGHRFSLSRFGIPSPLPLWSSRPARPPFRLTQSIHSRPSCPSCLARPRFVLDVVAWSKTWTSGDEWDVRDGISKKWTSGTSGTSGTSILIVSLWYPLSPPPCGPSRPACPRFRLDISYQWEQFV